MLEAAGFKCPGCGQDRLADIIESKDLPHVMMLRCVECGYEWLVEAS